MEMPWLEPLVEAGFSVFRMFDIYIQISMVMPTRDRI